MKHRKGLFLSLVAVASLAGWLVSPAALRAQAADKVSAAKDLESSYAEDLDLTKNEFKSETKAGAVFSTGNTKSFLVDGTSFTLYRIKRFENKFSLGAYFNRVSSSVANPGLVGTIANYIYGFYRLDYYFLPLTTVYVGGGGYVDEVKGIDLAGVGFLGVSHYFFRKPKYSLNVSLGYDYTFEDRIFPNPDVSIHAVAFGLNYQQQFNDHVGFGQKIKLLENGGNGRDLRLYTDTELKLGMTKHLAIVLGFHTRFDNEPVPGFKKLDTISDVSLALTFGGNPAKTCP
ncbi:MAG: DUF481 domain-containing protein [bacterium]